MNRVVPDPVRRQPWALILPLTVLVLFGAVVLDSAAAGNFNTYARAHLVRFAVFLTTALVVSRLRTSVLRAAAYPTYLVILVLLMIVEAIGAVKGGSQRWIDLGFMVLQPSEFMKPAIVLVLARYFEGLPAAMVTTWRALAIPAVLLGLPVGLVMLQPDLGTGLAITFGGVVVLFLAGLPLRWFIVAGTAALVTIPFAFFFLLHPYQQRRVTTFLDPENDPLGSGYHITQSKIAIGSGGMFGKGFGQGTQSHLDYLPEPHTDFVFATMAEEWGLLGGLAVLLAFGFILNWGWSVAQNSTDRFTRLLAGGMTATVFFYVAINLMMVMGLAPVVGIPLPFMSHGGSSMLTNMICLGTLMMIDRENRGRRPSGLR